MRPFRMSGSGLEFFPHVREWLGDPHGCLGVFGTPSRMSESGREPSVICGSGRETFLELRE